MQLTDIFSICALVISLVSLYVAIRSSGFSKITKLAELRATVLAKASEAWLSNSRLHRLHLEWCAVAQEYKDSEMMKLLELPEIEENQRGIDMIYKKIASVPVKNAAAVYESIYHDLSHVCGKIQALEERFISAKERFKAKHN